MNRLILLGVLMVAATAAQAEQTLYEQMGGEPKMRAIAEEFTRVLLADDRTNFTFAETDTDKFTQLFFEQLSEVTGGPVKYTGRSMRESHDKLNITNGMFNALVEDLYIAFDRNDVPYRLQNKVMAIFAPMQRDIVKPGAAEASKAIPPAKPPGG
ncbi:MAG: group I truncated hemoglobin [Steroidobacteraceae bacterium]